jgi:uncharacterized protein YjbI with pentapeptide repeats
MTSFNENDPYLQKDKEWLEKRKLLAEAKKTEREEDNLSRTGGFFARVPILSSVTAMVLSVSSLFLTAITTCTQSAKTAADQALDLDKRCSEILAKATDAAAPTYSRVAFIWSLRSFWDKKHAEVVANALALMIVNESQSEVVEACTENLGRGYDNAPDPSDKDFVRSALFGTPPSRNSIFQDLGIIRRAMVHLDQSRDWSQISRDSRRNQLVSIIEKNKEHLQNSNFNSLSLDRQYLPSANFSGSDFSHAMADSWNLDNVNFSSCCLDDAHFTNASLRNANFSGCSLTYTDFGGSDLYGARFYAADCRTAILAKANVKEAKGVDLGRAEHEGAVVMSSTDFITWTRNGRLVPQDLGERTRWKDEGFNINRHGGPVFRDKSLPKQVVSLDQIVPSQ